MLASNVNAGFPSAEFPNSKLTIQKELLGVNVVPSSWCTNEEFEADLATNATHEYYGWKYRVLSSTEDADGYTNSAVVQINPELTEMIYVPRLRPLSWTLWAKTGTYEEFYRYYTNMVKEEKLSTIADLASTTTRAYSVLNSLKQRFHYLLDNSCVTNTTFVPAYKLQLNSSAPFNTQAGLNTTATATTMTLPLNTPRANIAVIDTAVSVDLYKEIKNNVVTLPDSGTNAANFAPQPPGSTPADDFMNFEQNVIADPGTDHMHADFIINSIADSLSLNNYQSAVPNLKIYSIHGANGGTTAYETPVATEYSLVKSLEWVRDRAFDSNYNIKVVNMSLATEGGDNSPAVWKAMEELQDRGIAVVQSVGNAGRLTNNDGRIAEITNRPEGAPNITVGTLDANNKMTSSFSDRGIDIVVKIGEPTFNGNKHTIVQTEIGNTGVWGSTFVFSKGTMTLGVTPGSPGETSIAATKVSATIALMKNLYPNMTLAQIKESLFLSTDPVQPVTTGTTEERLMEDTKNNWFIRFGQFNAEKALAYAKSHFAPPHSDLCWTPIYEVAEASHWFYPAQQNATLRDVSEQAAWSQSCSVSQGGINEVRTTTSEWGSPALVCSHKTTPVPADGKYWLLGGAWYGSGSYWTDIAYPYWSVKTRVSITAPTDYYAPVQHCE